MDTPINRGAKFGEYVGALLAAPVGYAAQRTGQALALREPTKNLGRTRINRNGLFQAGHEVSSSEDDLADGTGMFAMTTVRPNLMETDRQEALAWGKRLVEILQTKYGVQQAILYRVRHIYGYELDGKRVFELAETVPATMQKVQQAVQDFVHWLVDQAE